MLSLDKKRKISILLFCLITISVSTAYYIMSKYATTDNARIKMGNIHVAAEVFGYVKKIYFKNNSKIKKGDLIIEIDPEKYEIDMKKQRANMIYYEAEQKRYKKLFKEGFISESEYDKVKQELELAKQNYELAKYKLEKTKIFAQEDGILSNADEIKVGDFVKEGISLFNIVNKNDIWIEANFKEIEISEIKPDQIADIYIDTFSGKKWTAKVKSITPATGAEFSLLPAQNTSGNWIKVVQRINVRLEFLDEQDLSNLATGMSVYVKIRIK